MNGMCNNPSDVSPKPMCPGDCGKPPELEHGHQDGSFEGFDLENLHGLFNIKMPPGKSSAAARGSARNDMKGIK